MAAMVAPARGLPEPSPSRSYTGSGMRALLVLLAALVLAGIAAAAVPAADRPARARAEAVSLAGTLGGAGALATRDGREQATGAFSVDGAVATGGRLTVSASRAGGSGRASASAVVESVALFGGLVQASRVRRDATAAGGATRYDGAVEGLRIGERAVGDVTAERTYALPGGAGVVTVNRGREGLHVQLAEAVDRWPAGTVVAVASADATARDAVRPAPTPTPAPTASPSPSPSPSPGRRPNSGKGRSAGDAPPSARERRASRRRAAERAARRRAARESARLAAADHAVPVGGAAEVADDWGGPRQIGPHQGNDIFAPFGSPVLAVADGRVEKVGTLPISGNRLWVRTDAGDTFFYAHLASFAPAARTGARVKAGTVLGYVGNTGDAEPTPPHLHFEVHPGDGDPIDPHTILTTWQERAGIVDATDATERPGALVEVRDLIDG